MRVRRTKQVPQFDAARFRARTPARTRAANGEESNIGAWARGVKGAEVRRAYTPLE